MYVVLNKAFSRSSVVNNNTFVVLHDVFLHFRKVSAHGAYSSLGCFLQHILADILTYLDCLKQFVIVLTKRYYGQAVSVKSLIQLQFCSHVHSL